MKKLVISSIVILMYFGAPLYAADWTQQLKGVLQKNTKSADPQLEPAIRALTGFSEQEEITIGRQAAGNLLGAAPLVNDLNAFAAPGGYVFVTKGLYGLLRNESELAGVLAHEIAHVTHKHHLKLLQQSRLVEGGNKVLRRAVGENQQIKNLIGNGAEIFSRSLDKDAEFEADRTAVVLAARAGYDAFGLPAVLQEIGRGAKNDSSVALLFKTHPRPDERLVHLEQAIGNRLDSLKGATLEKRFYRLRP